MKRLIKSAFRHVGLEVVRSENLSNLHGHLRDLLADLRVDCVIDVGANEGQFARSLRDHGFRGYILSFEPVPAMAPRLASELGRDPLWRHLPLALGDQDGRLTLHVPRRSLFASALPASEYGRTAFQDRPFDTLVEEVVPVRRLDSLFAQLRDELGFERPFLKLDTQGYDLHVLRGAQGSLESICGLLTEMSLRPLYEGMPDIADSLEAVRTAGFEITGLFPVVRDASGALIEVDCVARRPFHTRDRPANFPP